MTTLDRSQLDSVSSFPDLNIKLDLEVDGKKGEIFASHIEEIKLDLYPYGFEGRLRFSTFDDEEMVSLFASEKMMKMTLTFTETSGAKKGTPLLVVQGIVYQRSYKIELTKIQSQQKRVHTILFADPAKVTWGNHFPLKILIDETFKNAIEAEKNPLISLKYDWEELNKTSPIIAFNLDPKNGPTQRDKVSFYSFLMWYLHEANGILDYNIKENAYSLLGKKAEAGSPIIVAEKLLTPGICHYPEPPRHHKREIKYTVQNQDPKDEENPLGFQSVRHDAFEHANYHLYPEQISPASLSTLSPQKPLLSFALMDLVDSFSFDQILPGSLITIKGDEKKRPAWYHESFIKDQEFRIRDVYITLNLPDPSEKAKKAETIFRTVIKVVAESKDEVFVSRPEFNSPHYPFFIPGTVLSEAGDKEQTTFNLTKNEKSSLTQYQVKIPLAGADKKVVVPFTPDLSSGQFYFPLCKDQQVMVAAYFQAAKIERVLDWQPLAKLPIDTQASQTVFGSNGKDKYTLQKHEFNGKDPVFTIKQSSSPDQTQTVLIQEKKIVITVEEKGKHTSTFQFDRDSGWTLKVEDKDAGVTQQTVYDSKAMTHTSKGSGGTSTFTQKPDSISLECKTFNAKCEEGTLESSKTFTIKAANKVVLDTPITAASGKVQGG